MANEVVGANPTPELANDEFKLEVVDSLEQENAVVEDAEKLALNEKIQELEAKLETVSQPPTQMGLTADQLKEILNAQNKPKVEENKKPTIDYAKLMEKANKEFYNDPSKTVLELITPILQEVNTKYENENLQLKKELSRSQLLFGENKTIYEKYKDEVEAEAANINSPNAYLQAAERVKMKHLDELVSEQAEARLNQLLEEKLKELGVNPQESQVASPPQFTNATQVPQAKKPNPNRLTITTAQENFARQFALTKGLPYGTEDQKLFVINYLKAKGELK